MKRVTLAQVAALAGVSGMTASYTYSQPIVPGTQPAGCSWHAASRLFLARARPG
jgi:hypothetical protein